MNKTKSNQHASPKDRALRGYLHRLCTTALALLCVVATPLGRAQAQELLDEGDGYQHVRLSDSEFARLLRNELSASSSSNGQQKPQAPLSDEIIVLKSLRGVRDADIPSWLVEDLLEQQGVSSFADLTDEELDSPIDTLTISVDAVRAMGAGSKSGALQKLSFCEKKRKDKTESIERDINSLIPTLARPDDPAVDAELNGEFLGRGTFRVVVHYVLKSRCGIPYGAEFQYAEVFVDATLDGGYGISGTVKKALSQHLFKKHFPLWHGEKSWWLYFFQFEAEMDLAIDVGVKLDVEAETTIAAVYRTAGSVGLTWSCDSRECTKTRNDVDLKFAEPNNPELGYSAGVKVRVTPYVDVNFQADLDMYYGAIDLARAKIGVVGAVPVTVLGYVGNICSDANGDGVHEQVSGLALDIAAELYAYLEVELGNKDYRYAIDLNLFGWKQTKKGSLHYNDSFVVPVYSRPLYFRDLLSGGSSMFEAVIFANDPTRTDGGIVLSSRLCHPFSEALTYEVDWGDGSAHYVGKGGDVAHVWPEAASYQVRARLVRDEGGRTFEPRWTTRQIGAAPSATAFGLRHVGGSCVHPLGGAPVPDLGTTAVLFPLCTDEPRLQFRLLANRSLQHVSSGKCLHPEGGSANPEVGTRLVFWEGCSQGPTADSDGNRTLAFEMTAGGSIRHINSGLCVHPNGGSATPSPGTELVLWNSCDEPRLKFETIPAVFGLQHVGGSCVHPLGGAPVPSTGTTAILFPLCADEPRLQFRLLANGSLQHVSSGMCIHPEGGSPNPEIGTRLVFWEGCGDGSSAEGNTTLAFEMTVGGSIRHINSGLCVHPSGESEAPSPDTELVLWDSCDEPRLRFDRFPIRF